MSAVDVLRNDEIRERALAVPRLEPRLDSGFRAGPITVASVDDAAVRMKPDRVQQPLGADALDQGVELRPAHQREDGSNGMELHLHQVCSVRSLSFGALVPSDFALQFWCSQCRRLAIYLRFFVLLNTLAMHEPNLPATNLHGALVDLARCATEQAIFNAVVSSLCHTDELGSSRPSLRLLAHRQD